MAKEEEEYRAALAGKKIPILTLDNNWHKLFTQDQENEEIKALEERLNEYLKQQGKANSEIKSLNSYKKKLMNEIVAIMELPDSKEKERKMSENKRLIEETNVKLEDYRDEMLELPRLIDDTNYELMIATMHVCYDKIQQNTQEIEAINGWIQDFRNQLKRKVLQKQQREVMNDELYSYMHAIFGPDVIEMFDMKYNPQNVLNKEKDIVQTEKKES
ncbi:MAG: hypothetical protein II273_09575 [Lachnospiraceae bacterium]|mgnify:FL=1|nr:hypothetical protein [Lachnospiraceae bacterium]MEE1257898.1 hypothetical protein [Lachnospiraceae bacterium]